MKSQIEFETYYQSHLKGDVEKLEKKRLVIASKYSFKVYKKRFLWLLFGVSTLFITLNFFPSIDPGNFVIIPFLSCLYLMFAPIYIFIKRNVMFDPLINEYKTTVIPKLLQLIDERLKYEPKNGIDLQEFNHSGLFDRPTSFTTEDLVTGEVDNYSIRLADVNASLRTTTKGKDSHRSIEHIFIGMYGYTRLQKVFSTPIYIKPTYTGIAKADSLLSKFMSFALVQTIKDHITSGTIKTGNTVFDGYFNVRSQSAEEVTRVITPVFINMLLAFKKQLEVPLHIGMIENELHFGFSGVNLFEVNAHTSLTEKNITLMYFNYLNLVVGLAQAIDALHMSND